LLARRDIKERIEGENERWKELKKKNLSEEDRVQAISRIIFDLLDINADGSIDSHEIRLALQEFGFGPTFLLKKQVSL
jgi:Ca2+-binding EF-hand superfamily protein